MVDSDRNGKKSRRWPAQRLFNLDKIRGKVAFSDPKLQDLYDKIETLIRTQIQDIYGNVSDYKYLYIIDLLMERVRGALKDKNTDQTASILEGTAKQFDTYIKELVDGLGTDFSEVIESAFGNLGVTLSEDGLQSVVKGVQESLVDYFEDIYNALPELQKKVSDLEDLILLVSEQVAEIYKDTHDGQQSNLTDLKSEIISNVSAIKKELTVVKQSTSDQLEKAKTEQLATSVKLKTSFAAKTSEIINKRMEKFNRVQTSVQKGIKREFKNVQTIQKTGVEKLGKQHQDIKNKTIAKLNSAYRRIDKFQHRFNAVINGIFSAIGTAIRGIYRFVKFSINLLVVKPLKAIWSLTKKIWGVVGKGFWAGLGLFLMTPVGMRMLGSVLGFIWYRFIQPAWKVLVDIGHRLERVLTPFGDWIDGETSFKDAFMQSLRNFKNELLDPFVSKIKELIWGPENKDTPLLTLIWNSIKKGIAYIWEIPLPLGNTLFGKFNVIAANAVNSIATGLGVGLPWKPSSIGEGAKIGDILTLMYGLKATQLAVNAALYGAKGIITVVRWFMTNRRNAKIDGEIMLIQNKLDTLLMRGGAGLGNNSLVPGARRSATAERYKFVGKRGKGGHYVDLTQKVGKNGNFFKSVSRQEVANYRLGVMKANKMNAARSKIHGRGGLIMFASSLAIPTVMNAFGASQSTSNLVQDEMFSGMMMAEGITGLAGRSAKLASAGEAAGFASRISGLSKTGGKALGWVGVGYGAYNAYKAYDGKRSFGDNWMNNDQFRDSASDAGIMALSMAGGPVGMIAGAAAMGIKAVVEWGCDKYVAAFNEALDRFTTASDNFLSSLKNMYAEQAQLTKGIHNADDFYKKYILHRQGGEAANEFNNEMNDIQKLLSEIEESKKLEKKYQAEYEDEWIFNGDEWKDLTHQQEVTKELQDKLNKSKGYKFYQAALALGDEMAEKFKTNKMSEEDVKQLYSHLKNREINDQYNQFKKNMNNMGFNFNSMINSTDPEVLVQRLVEATQGKNDTQKQELIKLMKQQQADLQADVKAGSEQAAKFNKVLLDSLKALGVKMDAYKPQTDDQHEEENISLIEVMSKGENIM